MYMKVKLEMVAKIGLIVWWLRYSYDVTKSMFCWGNITEKLRLAALDCSGETVVDLYAGD